MTAFFSILLASLTLTWIPTSEAGGGTSRLDDLLRAMEAIPPGPPDRRAESDRSPVQPGERGPYKVHHAFDGVQYTSRPPPTDYAVLGVWTQTVAEAPRPLAGAPRAPGFVLYWEPLAWIREERRWVEEDPWEYRDEKEERFAQELLEALLENPLADASEATRWRKCHADIVRKAEAIASSREGVEAIRKEMEEAPRRARRHSRKDDYLSYFERRGAGVQPDPRDVERDAVYLRRIEAGLRSIEQHEASLEEKRRELEELSERVAGTGGGGKALVALSEIDSRIRALRSQRAKAAAALAAYAGSEARRRAGFEKILHDTREARARAERELEALRRERRRLLRKAIAALE